MSEYGIFVLIPPITKLQFLSRLFNYKFTMADGIFRSISQLIKINPGGQVIAFIANVFPVEI